VKIENFTFLNALIYIGENGCKWRALPEKFGPWHSIYMRFNRWAKNGVLERVVTALQADRLVDLKVFSLDSTSIKVHPDAHRALKKRKTGDREVTGGWNTKIHAVVGSDTLVKGFSLSAGNASDAGEGRLLRETVGPLPESAALLMDRAYEDDLTRLTAWGLRFKAVVPPKKNRDYHFTQCEHALSIN
jgi:transposase